MVDQLDAYVDYLLIDYAKEPQRRTSTFGVLSAEEEHCLPTGAVGAQYGEGRLLQIYQGRA